MKPVIIIAIVIVFGIGIGLSLNVSAEEEEIPHWSGILVVWYAEKMIDAREFLDAVGYLHNKKIINFDDGQRNISYASSYEIDFNDPLLKNNQDGYDYSLHDKILLSKGEYRIVKHAGDAYIKAYVGNEFLASYYCPWC